MKHFLLLFVFLPILLYGQDSNSIFDYMEYPGSGDTTFRQVFSSAEEMPRFKSGEKIEEYFIKDSLSSDIYPCCAIKGIIIFVVEPDSSITEKYVYVRAVNCEYGSFYNKGKEIEEIESKIMKMLDSLPAVIPGKIRGKNVAVKMFIPIEGDCYRE